MHIHFEVQNVELSDHKVGGLIFNAEYSVEEFVTIAEQAPIIIEKMQQMLLTLNNYR